MGEYRLKSSGRIETDNGEGESACHCPDRRIFDNLCKWSEVSDPFWQKFLSRCFMREKGCVTLRTYSDDVYVNQKLRVVR